MVLRSTRASLPAMAALMAGLAFMMAIAACGGSPPKPTVAKAALVVAADANPDSGGRPSPIVVRVYQLKEEGAFANADFFALFDKEQETLGASVVAREEYELKPGESRELELKIAPEAKFVGAVAGFRDIRNSRWKVVSATPEKKLTDLLRKNKVTLTVARSELTLAIGK
jgi:type VI secretion system protein VasD